MGRACAGGVYRAPVYRFLRPMPVAHQSPILGSIGLSDGSGRNVDDDKPEAVMYEGAPCKFFKKDPDVE